VAEVLRKLENEISMNKFDDVKTKQQARDEYLANLTPKDK
jgi:hypothetical protein